MISSREATNKNKDDTRRQQQDSAVGPNSRQQINCHKSDRRPAPNLTAIKLDEPNMKSKRQPEMSQANKLVASLRAAVEEGKVELVRLLLRCGADPNAQDQELGNTPLHEAAWNGFSETVQVLCKYRALTSTRNKAQFTPLHMACQQGHNQTIRLLLMANARTDAKNSYGDTPLHTAARYGHAGAARILLSAKSDPNLVNKNHDTPLHIAAAMGRRKLTKILMQNNSEPAIKNKQNETPMDIALRKDLIEIQELIANPPPARQQPMDGARHQQLEQKSRSRLSLGPLRLDDHDQILGACDCHALRRARRREPARNRHRHAHQARLAANSSNEDLDQLDEWLGHEPECRFALARPLQRAGVSRELPVDVPDADRRTRVFASVQSLSAGLQQQQPPKGRLRRPLRTKTLQGGVDVGRLLETSEVPQRAGSLEMRRREEDRSESRLAPDAWPEGRTERVGKTAPPVAAKWRRSSPDAGSLMSGLSKRSGGRPTGALRRVTAIPAAKRSLLGARRPLPGKLSLLRLRTMVAKRQAAAAAAAAVQRVAPETETGTAPADCPQGGRSVAAGRREERETRARADEGVTEVRAPNGIKLVGSRPLAPLEDRSQLYAVPKKQKNIGKQKDEQPAEQVANDHAKEGEAERAASGGPALTSDGGQSTTPSPTDPPPCARNRPDEGARGLGSDAALVGVHPADCQGDLYSPGYSVIRAEELPCICDHHSDCELDDAPPRQPANEATSKAQSEPVAKSSNRLRQFLHLGGQKAAPSDSKEPKQNGKKPWLISRLTSASRSAAPANELASPEPEPLDMATNTQGQELIRPKSLLDSASGGSNSELIAAQKSLAAAAAAKVRRDRLFKVGANEDGPAMEPVKPAAGRIPSAGGVLTVKTSEPGEFWAAQRYLMQRSQLAGGRSGTNSAGMSDSSPSNNGADSDNSIQTQNTGSDSVGPTESISNGSRASGDQSPPTGPLGILSRILLNNAARQQGGPSAIRSQQQQVAGDGQVSATNSSSSSTLRNQPALGGSLSSSALSSPATSNENPSPLDQNQDQQVASQPSKLQQLESRSRRPIVLSSSNELKAANCYSQPPGPTNAHPVPKLPVSRAPYAGAQVDGTRYSADRRPLCTYHHALSQPPIIHYSGPYVGQKAAAPAPRLIAGRPLSHSSLDLTLPAEAVNYEYYLEGAFTGGVMPHAVMYPAARGGYLGDPLQQSVYVPSLQGGQATRPSTVMGEPIGQARQAQGQLEENEAPARQQRPKSSLDAPILGQRQLANGLANSSLYSTENSIYAGDQAAAFSSHHSRLTVLPAESQPRESPVASGQLAEGGGHRSSPFCALAGSRQLAANGEDKSSWMPASHQPYRTLVQLNWNKNVCNRDQEAEDKGLPSAKPMDQSSKVIQTTQASRC